MLYPHQVEFINEIKNSIRKLNNRIMCVAPCGFGKSVVMKYICDSAVAKGNSYLILVHRIELVNQLEERGLNVEMVQTVSRHLNEQPNYNIIIIDEAHLALAASYRKIIEHYTNAVILYFTATPQRLDGLNFSIIADDMVVGKSVRWLIANNYLAPFDYYAPKLLVDASKLSISQGDYTQSDIIEQMDKPKVYGDIYNEWCKFAYGKKTIVYASSLSHSMSIVSYFNSKGINASHIDGNTDKNERKRIINDFKSGKITILSNYALIVEGFDVPDCECCIIARPTQSLVIHIQSTMRCMRYRPNKKAIILDFVGNYERHGLPDDDREWTLEKIRKQRISKNDEPKVLIRNCPNCFKVYSASLGLTCPYCKCEVGKTKAEIEYDTKQELIKIEAFEKKQKRIEVGMCKTKADLERIAKERGYAKGWVWNMMKIKGIKR